MAENGCYRGLSGHNQRKILHPIFDVSSWGLADVLGNPLKRLGLVGNKIQAECLFTYLLKPTSVDRPRQQ